MPSLKEELFLIIFYFVLYYVLTKLTSISFPTLTYTSLLNPWLNKRLYSFYSQLFIFFSALPYFYSTMPVLLSSLLFASLLSSTTKYILPFCYLKHWFIVVKKIFRFRNTCNVRLGHLGIHDKAFICSKRRDLLYLSHVHQGACNLVYSNFNPRS